MYRITLLRSWGVKFAFRRCAENEGIFQFECSKSNRYKRLLGLQRLRETMSSSIVGIFNNEDDSDCEIFDERLF
jgi:hypothetical protein